MLYYLYQVLVRNELVSDGMFSGVIFRSALAILTSFLIVLLTGGRVIRWLMKQKVGDRPEFYNTTLNELTKNKKNTPTMGGIIIIAAIMISVLLFANLGNFYVRMAVFCMVYLAVLGGFDDWLKLTTARRTPGSRDGLLAYEKLLFQVGLGVMLAVFIYKFPTKAVIDPSMAQEAHLLNWPFFRDIALPSWAFAILTVVVITGSSNAVNLTDGMDGLAAGCMAIVAFAFLILAYITGDWRWAQLLHFNWVQHTAELSIVCGAIAGACLGFLWYNCNPAQVFMGDTGSLALGGALGTIAVATKHEIVLAIIGGLFVLETVSVIVQVTSFRLTGKRVFRMAPIHHHFEALGWTESQVVIRFWIISFVLALIGLSSLKLR